MDIVSRGHDWFSFRLDTAILEFFRLHGIRSAEFGPERWRAGDIIAVRDNRILEPFTGIYAGHELSPFGAFSYAFSHLPIDAQVGRYCSISWNVQVMGPHHGYHLVSNSEILYRHETSFRPAILQYCDNWTFHHNPQKPAPAIGHDVWIAQNVLVGRGLTIGHGAVVGAGSVVTRDVAPYAIVGGAPARFIKWRFDERIIEAMLRLAWWDYPLPALARLSLGDPERFVGEMEEVIASGAIGRLLPLGPVEAVLTAASP